MVIRNWKSHAAVLLLSAAAAWYAGWMAGYPFAGLAIVTLLYCIWHVINLWRLFRWIHNPDSEVPRSLGLWAELFNGIHSRENKARIQQEQDRSAITEFRNVALAFPDAMLVVKTDGIIIWCNEAAVRLLGLRTPDDIGKSVFGILRDPDFFAWLDGQGDVTGSLDVASPRDTGRRLTASSFPFRKNQRLIILRNVTATHNLEQIKRDLVANISHELRTPLTVLRGYLELLDDHPAAEVRESVGRMLGQALQMQTLLDDLLELSRLQSVDLRGEDELIDVPAMLTQLEEQAQSLSRGAHHIEFRVDPQLLMMGVGSDLESAFQNLITNAIKYTPKGGSIFVAWEKGPAGQQLCVRDTGIGIPDRDISRVTERFYRVRSDRARETGGSGLGLAIVKHVLQEHQARLTISSQVGLGSEFICAFPGERARTRGDSDHRPAQAR